VAFLSPEVYGRSPTENSSFIASSSFPDPRLHGTGFVARLSGSTAEWLSMVFAMGLGPEPFQFVNGELRFEPKPILPKWLFTAKTENHFPAHTFGLKLFGKTWILYRNPTRQDTFGVKELLPVRYDLRYENGDTVSVDGNFLPNALARELRDGKLARVEIELR